MVRCQAITKSTKQQCSREADLNSDFCWQHKPKEIILNEEKKFEKLEKINVNQEYNRIRNRLLNDKNISSTISSNISSTIQEKEEKKIQNITSNIQNVEPDKELITIQGFRDFYDKKRYTLTSRKNNEILQINEEIYLLSYPIKRFTSEEFSKIKFDKIQELLQNDFYQFEVMQGILTVTLSFFELNLNETSKRIHNWIKDLQLISQGTYSYAFDAMIENIKDLFIIKAPKIDKYGESEDYLIHELFVGLFGTNNLRKWIPNFAYVLGGFNCSVPILDNKNKIQSYCGTKGLMANYVIYEKIVGKSLDKVLINETITKFRFLSIFIQLCYALHLANIKIDFTHYDLHTGNILLKIPFKKLFYIPYETENGIEYVRALEIATIIDYGLSHIKYDNKDFGIYSKEEFGILPHKRFPLFDIYKVLLYSMYYFARKNNRDCLEVSRTMLKFFTEEDFKEIIEDEIGYYYALPSLRRLVNISLIDFIKYIRNNIDFSTVIFKDVPKNEKILKCVKNCLSLEEVEKEIY